MLLKEFLNFFKLFFYSEEKKHNILQFTAAHTHCFHMLYEAGTRLTGRSDNPSAFDFENDSFGLPSLHHT